MRTRQYRLRLTDDEYYDLKKLLNKELREKYNEEKLNLIIDLGLVVPLEKEKRLYFLKSDFFICKKILEEKYLQQII